MPRSPATIRVSPRHRPPRGQAHPGDAAASRRTRTASTGPTRPGRGVDELHRPFEAQGVRQWWLDYCSDDGSSAHRGDPRTAGSTSCTGATGRRAGMRGFSLSRIGASLPAYTTRRSVRAVGRAPQHGAFHRGHPSGLGEPGVCRRDDARPRRARGVIRQPRHRQLRGRASARRPVPAMGAARRVPADPATALRPRRPAAVEVRGTRSASAAADYLRLRESLVPYLYTAGAADLRHRAADGPGAVPRLARARRRPTGTTPSTCSANQLLVAPVTKPGLSTTTPVWFPPGTWTDFFTGETFRGPGHPDGRRDARPHAGATPGPAPSWPGRTRPPTSPRRRAIGSGSPSTRRFGATDRVRRRR